MTNRLNKKPTGRLKEIIEVFGRYNLIHGITPEKLRHILEDLGPTFVKLGQLLSMRPDMIPEEFCNELTLLRTEVKPMSFEEVGSVLLSEYGEDYADRFIEIEERPLGSASIAQVHAAVLRDGRKVVLKIQRPGIYERMDQDVRLLQKAAVIINIVSRTGKVIDLKAVLEELWKAAKEEMNFLAEAEHIRRFTELSKRNSFAAFPKVVWELTTARVLCMENVGGIQIDDTEALIGAGYDLKDLAYRLASCYVGQVLDDGFFHADPHPGNLRIRDGKIVFIDLGMVGTLSGKDRQMFRKALLAVVNNDIYELKMAILGISKHTGRVNHSRLSADVEEMLIKYASMELGDIVISQTMNDMLSLAEANNLSFPPGISMLSRGIITIEGVLERLDPETSIIDIFAKVFSKSIFKDFDFKKELIKNTRMLYNIGSRSGEVSSNLMEVLKLAAMGQSKLNMELVGSEEPLRKIGSMVNRLIVALLCAAALLGSSLICLTDMEPKVLGIPLLGAFGYLAAFIMSIWLLIGIIRNRKL
jgi:ubiquinone biosynthesis protein